MKSFVFAKRTMKEILRDPLSYIFCLGFPLVMLAVMTVVDQSIPAQAGMTVFHIENLAPGIAYFGLTFLMLFTSIQLSKDRTMALLLRLYASPMKPIDYILGYTLPVIGLGVLQMIICFVASFIGGLITGYHFSIGAILLSILSLLPSVFLFIGFGLLFGAAVNEKAAPGLCSIIITLVGMIGGVWMDIDGLGGAIKKVASVLPFYHGVQLAKVPISGQTDQVLLHLGVTLLYAVFVYLFAVCILRNKMSKDIK